MMAIFAEESFGMSECHCEYRIEVRAKKEEVITLWLNCIARQRNGIGEMIEMNHYCNDVLISLPAADKSEKSLVSVLVRICISARQKYP